MARLHALLPLRYVVLILSVYAYLPPCGSSQALPQDGAPATSVLLTFDVEADEDVAALRKLQLTVPATYFITGRFAEQYPDVVRNLARDRLNTIGSHSYTHQNLTALTPAELHKDLLLSRLLLRDLLGRAPTWFRAPLLETNERVADSLIAIGFTHDSSNRERWMSTAALFELPVSGTSETLAADFDLFVTRRMPDAAALSWLIDRFEERTVLGRPLVLLMHPRVIVDHGAVLSGLIEHATRRGAAFLSAEQYARQTESRTASLSGVWINLGAAPHEPQQISRDLHAAGITDVFLMAKDPEGNRYFAETPAEIGNDKDIFGRILVALKAAGIRVHAWLPVFSDPITAHRRPELAMVDGSGRPSESWLSPSHPEVRAHIAALARALASTYPIDGLHLDYVRYPGLDYDYGRHALDRFASWSGVQGASASSLLTEHYTRWTDWRVLEIANFVTELRELMPRQIIISAALIGDAALNYRSSEAFGQSYPVLADHLDWIVPMAYFRQDQRPVEWIAKVIAATRFHVGQTPVLAGIEAYQEPGRWTLDAATFRQAITLARTGTEGVVFYPYLHLFSRAGTGRDMPPGSADMLPIPDSRRAPATK